MDEQFQGIWRRALNEPSLAMLTPGLIEGWAGDRGLDVTCVEKREVGAFGKTLAIVLTRKRHEGVLSENLPRG